MHRKRYIFSGPKLEISCKANKRIGPTPNQSPILKSVHRHELFAEKWQRENMQGMRTAYV
jgi:hypothetical protein